MLSCWQFAMTPRTLYRWKSFWFGILILIFLGWGWASSMGTGDYIAINGSFDEVLRIDQSGGRIAIIRVLPDPIFSLPEAPLSKMFGKEDAPWFPPAFERGRPVDGWASVAVAHWFLMLLFLVAWSGWLGWRWRRMKRLQKTVDRVSR